MTLRDLTYSPTHSTTHARTRRHDTRIPDLEEHLPASRPAGSPEPHRRDAHQLLPAPAPRLDQEAGHRPELHLVHGRRDVLPLSRGDRHGGAAHVLLPPDAGVGIPRYPGPPRRGLARHPAGNPPLG